MSRKRQCSHDFQYSLTTGGYICTRCKIEAWPVGSTSDVPRPAEDTRAPTPELADALEAFALARHRISAREGTIVSKYREDALQLVAAYNRIVELFARHDSANPVKTGTPDGAYLPSSAAESRAALQGDGEAPSEWSEEYWQLDQAVLDAEQAPRTAQQIAMLRKIRDGWDALAADARLGSALREAVAKTTRDTDLTFAIARDGALDIWPDTDATRKLSALLRSSPARDATGGEP